MRARRMPHQVKRAADRAPKSPACAADPERGLRGVVHEPGHFHLRIVPVVRQHGDTTQARQSRADEPVVGLVAESPAPAMPKDDQRPRRRGHSRPAHTRPDDAADRCRTQYSAWRLIGAEGGRSIGRHESQADRTAPPAPNRASAVRASTLICRHRWDSAWQSRTPWRINHSRASSASSSNQRAALPRRKL